MIKFKGEKEMIAFLRSYRNSYYEWIALKDSINVKSPMFFDFPSNFDYSDKVSIYNRDIVRKEELETQMREISDIIELLRDVNQDYYRTLYFKFIKFKTLEEIACMIHVSDRTMYRMYKKAKKKLFQLNA